MWGDGSEAAVPLAGVADEVAYLVVRHARADQAESVQGEVGAGGDGAVQRAQGEFAQAVELVACGKAEDEAELDE